MGKDWDRLGAPDGFRRQRNPADAGRDNVFGRTTRTAPEYTTGQPSRNPGDIGVSDRDLRPTTQSCAADLSDRLGVNYNSGRNVRCRRCRHWRFSGTPCVCSDGGDFPNVRGIEGNAMQAWHETWAREALRVLKPGAFAVVAGGSRTFHRLVCAMEDAGFRIVDCITHLHGQGFPKAGYVDRDRCPGMAGSLKPSVEFWTLAQKPAAGTIAENLAAHGTGALNIDAARTPSGGTHGSAASAGAGSGYGTVAGRGVYRGVGGKIAAPHLAGRWPANVVFSHVAADSETGEPGCVRVGTNWRCAPGCPVRSLDEQAGERPVSGAARQGHQQNPSSGGSTSIFPLQATGGALHNDFGSAARFFFCAKAASSERWGLCRTCDVVFQFSDDPPPAPDCPRHGARQPDFGPLFGGVAEPACACPPRALDAHEGHDRVLHPTVKPLDLMRWLVRLVVPPGGLLLDCFAGTGSTGVAALAEGARAVLVERDPDYARIAEGRLRAVGA